MKKIIALIITAFVFASCSKDSDNNAQFNISKIAGKWQLIEILAFNPENPDGPNLVSNGAILNLKLDGTFTSNDYVTYPGGTYSVSTDSIISLNYESVAASTEIRFKKIRNFSNTELVLDDDLSVFGTACAEGCAARYSKIND